MLPDNILSWTKNLVAKYNLQPGRRLGQHFLVDRTVLRTIVAAADLKPQESVLEVGGGLGVLTLALLSERVKLTVVELDKNLVSLLNNFLITSQNFKVVSADILKLSDEALVGYLNSPSMAWKLVANLPYEISGIFLRRFLAGNFRPGLMVLLLQKEVADRLVAPPGQIGLLSLLGQLYSRLTVVRQVPPSAFWPRPRVDSAIVKFTLRSSDEMAELLGSVAPDYFWRVARAGFTTKRKQLANSLTVGLKMDRPLVERALLTVGLKVTARPQELSLEQWIKLASNLA